MDFKLLIYTFTHFLIRFFLSCLHDKPEFFRIFNWLEFIITLCFFYLGFVFLVVALFLLF